MAEKTLVKILVIALICVLMATAVTVTVLINSLPESVQVKNVFVDVNNDGEKDLILEGNIIINTGTGEQNFLQPAE